MRTRATHATRHDRGSGTSGPDIKITLGEEGVTSLGIALEESRSAVGSAPFEFTTIVSIDPHRTFHTYHHHVCQHHPRTSFSHPPGYPAHIAASSPGRRSVKSSYMLIICAFWTCSARFLTFRRRQRRRTSMTSSRKCCFPVPCHSTILFSRTQASSSSRSIPHLVQVLRQDQRYRLQRREAHRQAHL